MERDECLALFDGTVRKEWLDYNEHMNVAGFVAAFDLATDELLDFLGIGEKFRRDNEVSTFVAEMHVAYKQELLAGEAFRITTQLLGFDAKRLHFFHRCYRGSDDKLAATNEVLALYVDMSRRAVTEMPDQIAARLDELHARHAKLPPPAEAGAIIQIPRRS